MVMRFELRKGANSYQLYRIILKSGILFMLLLFSSAKTVSAVDTVPTEEFVLQYENNKTLPVLSNEIINWPEGPRIGAKSAIVMEVDTGSILYNKNIDESLYPASITKMMTALLVMENTNLSDVVTFSETAIKNTEWGSSRIGIQIGEELTVEQCLYGLLLGSANEVAYGLAEHVGGDLDSFVAMMNKKAEEIGCTHTHFVNASGLPDENHYVSSYDMALIAREFFKNETLSLISGTYSYTIPATNKVNEERPLDNHHKMVTGKKYAYEGIIGGKTGFTSVARQTLVTCAQRNGIRLICVVMQDESPNQFLDSANLLDYGFNNFQKLPIADYETRYDLNSRTFFNTKLDIMGSSRSILSLNKSGYIVIPKNMEFEDADVTVQYLDNNTQAIAKLVYSVGGNYVGSTTIDYADNFVKTFEFAKILTDETDKEPQKLVPNKETIFISVKYVVFSVLKVLGILFAIIVITTIAYRYITSSRRKSKLNKKRYKQRSENTLKNRRAYKKRSENKKRKNQVVDNKKTQKSIYREMMQRSEQINSESNKDYSERMGFETNTYFDEEDAFDGEFEEDYRNYESNEFDMFEDENRW